MRTNRETSTWLKEITAQSLTMRENLEQAIVFFGGFTGDHRTFVSWNKEFLQKQRKMKKEAQERLMGDVGGTGKYNGTPPSDYCPSVERFRFVSENYLCEKCNVRFVNEANVMIHIRSVHDKDIRKMFASDASDLLMMMMIMKVDLIKMMHMMILMTMFMMMSMMVSKLMMSLTFVFFLQPPCLWSREFPCQLLSSQGQ